MMRIPTMRLIGDPMEGTGSHPAPQAAVRLWEGDEGSLKHWRSSANFVFLFSQKGVPRFLRLAALDSTEAPTA